MKKIVILKLGALGDIICMLPLISCIKEECGDADITWISSVIYKDFMGLFPDINENIYVNQDKIFKGRWYQKLFEIIKLWKKITFIKCDLIIVGNPDWRYRVLLGPALLRNSFKVCKPVKGRNRTIEYIRTFLGHYDYSLANYSYPKLNIRDVDPSIHFSIDEKYVGLVPGGTNNTLNTQPLRRWPIENYVLLAKSLIEQGFKIVILGDKNDEWTLEFFRDVDFKNLVGKTSFLEMVPIMKKLSLLISHDTGLLHVANLSQIPVLGLFGPTSPREVTLGMSNITNWDSLPCGPCYDGKEFADCANNLCMRAITPERVLSESLSLLNKRY